MVHWRPGEGRGRQLRPYGHGLRLVGRQRLHDGYVHDTFDEERRLRAVLRWRGRSGRLYRRSDNAAGHGSRGLHHGADTRRPLHRGCDRGRRPGAALLLRGHGAGTLRGLPPRTARHSVEAAPAARPAAQDQGLPAYPSRRDNLLPARGIHAAQGGLQRHTRQLRAFVAQ